MKKYARVVEGKVDNIFETANPITEEFPASQVWVDVSALPKINYSWNAVNTDGVEPLAHPAAVLGDVALRLRDDIASEPDQREASQRSAPAVERGLFLVPKVIE